jgi:thiamine-phosphate pyrophosphorylase
LEDGVDLIQIREKDLGARALEELVREAVRLAASAGAGVLVNDRLDVALTVGAAGVHLPSAGLPARAVRVTTGGDFLIAASTHNLAEARAAAEAGVSFIVFGPVFATPSKPQATGVGIEALRELCRDVAVPVFALGGIGPDHVQAIRACGAAGVAGISVFADPGARHRLIAAARADSCAGEPRAVRTALRPA